MKQMPGIKAHSKTTVRPTGPIQYQSVPGLQAITIELAVSLWLESMLSSINWWCTKGKGKLNR